MHPRKFIRDTIGLAGSQYVVRMLLMARGLIAARVLGPTVFGGWNAIMLLIEYGALAHAGTMQGLDQKVPARIVDGDAARLERVKRAGLFDILLLGGLFAAGCLIFFSRSAGQIRSIWGLGGVALALLVALLTNLSNYHTSLLRSHGNIGAMSAWSVIQALIGVAAGLALLPFSGAWGLLWGWLLGTVVALIYLRWQGRGTVPLLPLPSAESTTLVTSGFPLFVFLALNIVVRTLDRIIILRFLNVEALGYYSLAAMAVALLMYLPDSVAFVLYPQLLRRYHEAGKDAAAIRPMVERSLRAVALMLPALCGLAFLAVDDTVMWLLPRFAPGIAAVRILCFGAAALGLANLSAVVLMTLRRQWVLIPVGLVTTAGGAGLMLWAVEQRLGIRGVAWATLCSYAGHSTILLLAAYAGMEKRWSARVGFVLRSVVPLIAAILLAYGCEKLFPWGGATGPLGAVRLVASAILFLAIYGILMRPLAGGIGLRQVVLETRLPWMAGARVGESS